MNDFLFPVTKNGKSGFINQDGVLKIDFDFDDVSSFSDGLARIYYKNEIGYIDLLGNIVIKPSFIEASNFSQGLACVLINEKYGYIDKQGQIVIEPQYFDCSDFKEGLAKVFEDVHSKGVFIDLNGNEVLKGHDFKLSIVNDGIINFCELDGYGYMNKLGEYIIKPLYKYALPFHETLAAVSLKDRLIGEGVSFGFINSKNELVIDPIYKGADLRFSEGLCSVWNKSFGFIDLKGELKIPYAYYFADHFSEGMSVIKHFKNSDGYNYIDKSGKKLFKKNFSTAEKFTNGLAQVSIGKTNNDRRFGYINLEGEFVWDPTR